MEKRIYSLFGHLTIGAQIKPGIEFNAWIAPLGSPVIYIMLNRILTASRDIRVAL
jgi:hypothetical protein